MHPRLPLVALPQPAPSPPAHASSPSSFPASSAAHDPASASGWNPGPRRLLPCAGLDLVPRQLSHDHHHESSSSPPSSSHDDARTSSQDHSCPSPPCQRRGSLSRRWKPLGRRASAPQDSPGAGGPPARARADPRRHLQPPLPQLPVPEAQAASVRSHCTPSPCAHDSYPARRGACSVLPRPRDAEGSPGRPRRLPGRPGCSSAGAAPEE